jgi:5-methylcytosine-specific restriction endonuclease McrA
VIKTNYILKKKCIDCGKLITNRATRCNPCARLGDRSPFWRGGISLLRSLIHHSHKYYNWRKQVFERDNYTCQECGVRNGIGKEIYLEPHHIKSFSDILKEFLEKYNQFSPIDDKETLVRLSFSYNDFWNLDNGTTLCRECHYGKKNTPWNKNIEKEIFFKRLKSTDHLFKKGYKPWNTGLTGLKGHHTTPHTELTKEKIRRKKIGGKATEEHKNKISEGLKKHWIKRRENRSCNE